MGIVIVAEIIPKAFDNRIVVRCADRKPLTAYVFNDYPVSSLVGEVVLVSKPDRKLVSVSQDRTIPIHAKPYHPYPIGKMYIHHTFGVGTLIEVEDLGGDYRLVIDFQEVGRKVLLASCAKVKRFVPTQHSQSET